MNKVIIVALLYSGFIHSQTVPGNLVKNWSFDEISKKIKDPGSIDLAIDWTSPTKENADLFSKKAKSDLYMAPTNKHGVEEPYDGDVYAGFRAFSYNGRAGTRSYLQGQLKEPLKKDAAYCVKFRVSLADLSKYAVNNIGLALSNKPITENEINNFQVKADVQHSRNIVMDEQYTWKDICSVYISDGSEKYVTIGNFRPRDSTKALRMKKPRGVMGVVVADGYYFVENIVVTPIDSVKKCICEKNTGGEVKVVYRKYESADISSTPEKIIEYRTLSYAFKMISPQEKAKKTLDEISEILKNRPAVKLQIIGHSDENEEKSMRATNLSTKRAIKAKDYLVSKGISSTRLTTKGMKNEDLKIKNAKGLDSAKNRRVEFKLIE